MVNKLIHCLKNTTNALAIHLLKGLIHLPISIPQRGDMGSQHTNRLIPWSQCPHVVSLSPGQERDMSSSKPWYPIKQEFESWYNMARIRYTPRYSPKIYLSVCSTKDSYRNPGVVKIRNVKSVIHVHLMKENSKLT